MHEKKGKKRKSSSLMGFVVVEALVVLFLDFGGASFGF